MTGWLDRHGDTLTDEEWEAREIAEEIKAERDFDRLKEDGWTNQQILKYGRLLFHFERGGR